MTDIVKEAKRLQRLQTKRSKMKRDMKRVDQEIRLVRKIVRGLASPVGPDDQLPPRWKGKAK